jgi:predicted aminopeptidase
MRHRGVPSPVVAGSRSPLARRAVTIAAGALLAATLAGCTTAYLVRAAYEGARILWRREPIARVLANGDVTSEVREKLRLVLAARAFARERLGYEIGESYATLARIDGNAVVHVVTAAHRDRLAPYEWRFPIVGRVPYRGYFDRRQAEEEAAALEGEGLDTAVWPSIAFSTLGWFDDPLPSNLLDEDPVELVTVVFHELTHAQIYVPSAAAFNESLASFAGHRAAIGFFCDDAGAAAAGAGGDPPAPDGRAGRCALARARWADELVYAAVLAEAADALRVLYAAAPPVDERAVRRTEILAAATAAMRRRPLATPRYRTTDLAAVNNAVLLQQRLYRTGLDGFESVWVAHGEDLRAALVTIRAGAVPGGRPG